MILGGQNKVPRLSNNRDIIDQLLKLNIIDLEYAMAELKKQAAKIGANGVILESVGTSNSGGVISYGVYIPVTAKNVSGKAIYVFSNEE